MTAVTELAPARPSAPAYIVADFRGFEFHRGDGTREAIGAREVVELATAGLLRRVGAGRWIVRGAL